MKKNRILTNKYMLLALVLITMLAMSGCRTRLSNNSEVSNIKYDEDGFLTETYQMRRDELGLSTAEMPLLPDLGSADDDDSDEPEIDENLNVVPEEDNYVEPPETNTNTNTNNGSTTTRQNTTIRRYTSPSRSNSSNVTITFDANGGKVNGASKYNKSVPKGTTIGHLQVAMREKDGKEEKAIGWYTEKEEGKGTKITAPFKADKNMTFYAHWGDEKKEEETKVTTFTVRFLDDKGTELKKETVEKGKAATAPAVDEREGYTHSWDKDFSNVTANLEVKLVWTEEVVTKTYNITLTGDGEDQNITINGDTYENLPTPKRKGYPEAKWVDSEGNAVNNGDKINAEGDHSLSVDWGDKNVYEYWREDYDEKAPKAEDRVKYSIITKIEGLDPENPEESAIAEKIGDEGALVKSLISKAGTLAKKDEEPEFLVLYIKDVEKAEDLKKIAQVAKEKTGKSIVAISMKNADDKTLEDEEELLYKIITFNKIFNANTEEELKQASEELKVSSDNLLIETEIKE